MLAALKLRVPESAPELELELELELRRRAQGLPQRVSLVRLSVEAWPVRPPVLVRRGGKRGSGR
jgi:hypothetical protein